MLLAVACAVLAGVRADWLAWFPLASLVLPLLLGSMLLGPRVLPWFVVLVMALLVAAVARQPGLTDTDAASVAVYFLLGLVVLLLSFRRTRLGVAGWQGEDMFVDLRDRILRQSGVPALPPGWRAESALASSGGTLFAGDFVVTSMPRPDRFEVAVVDVSGNGEEAGTRALHLSGAFGGLVGALPAEDFLPAANDYLIRQRWAEGFATAVHLSLDLATGGFAVRTAGHPPAARRAGADGRWEGLASDGPVLGLIEGADFEAATGVLAPGDTLLLYTDGMVERPRADIDVGIARLLAQVGDRLDAEHPDLAPWLVRSLGSRHDDRAVVLVHRD